MAAMRLVPIEDDADFPYDLALAKLTAFEGMTLERADFAKMIEAGQRLGWNAEMIAAHEELARRGRCFRFEQFEAPYLRGTLAEDNIFFTILDGEHEAICKPVIEKLAIDLRVRIITC